jgi:hypothetical protein
LTEANGFCRRQFSLVSVTPKLTASNSACLCQTKIHRDKPPLTEANELCRRQFPLVSVTPKLTASNAACLCQTKIHRDKPPLTEANELCRRQFPLVSVTPKLTASNAACLCQTKIHRDKPALTEANGFCRRQLPLVFVTPKLTETSRVSQKQMNNCRDFKRGCHGKNVGVTPRRAFYVNSRLVAARRTAVAFRARGLAARIASRANPSCRRARYTQRPPECCPPSQVA